jgi:hypothetical protein
MGLDHISNVRLKRFGKILFSLSLAAIIGFSLSSYFNYQFVNKYAKPNIRDAVKYIENNIAPGDLVLCVIYNPTFHRYSKNSSHYVSYPSYTDINDKKDIELQLKIIISGKKRVWLVLNTEWYQPRLAEYTKDWLDTNSEEIKHLRKEMKDIANVSIYSYDLTKKISYYKH